MTDTVTVPREPTDEMWAAGERAFSRDPDTHHETVLANIWDAMLAAAPKAEPALCVSCEGKPSPENDPCHSCGASSPKVEQEPVAWRPVWSDGTAYGEPKNWPPLEGASTYHGLMGRTIQPLYTHHAPASDELPASILDIAAERQRQVTIEGWSHERDDGYVAGELAIAGACYGLIGSRNWAADAVREIWPKGWSVRWLKSKPNNPRRDLVKAGALIAAEIERLDRLAKHKGPQS